MSGDGARALIADVTPRRLVWWYLCVVASLTVLAGAVHGLIAPPTGLVRTFYADTGFSGDPLFQDQTTEISLAFLDEDPTLPRRFFSIEWSGFWFLPRATTVELYAGGDDRVDVAVDGQRVLRRNIAVGMHTVSETITLSAGAHEILVRYGQEGGGASLNIQYAVDGEPPGPLVPRQLFPERPDTLQFVLASGSYWLIRIVAVLWLVLLASLFMVFGGWSGLRALRYWRTVGAPRTAIDFGRRLLLVASPALLAPFVLFLLGPHTIYRANSGEFSAAFTDIAWPSLLVAVAAAWSLLLGIGCLICFLSLPLTRLYAALLLALGVLFWAQGNLWVGDYGALDGRAIEWDRLAGRVPYELAVWAVVPLLAALFSRSVSRFAPFTAQLFLVLQVGGLAITWGGPDADRRIVWAEPPPELFQFSSERNVIHVVLDEFQTDVFVAMLEEDGGSLGRTFTGFTFFADHLGAFPSTSLSLPAMLTGKEFRNEQPVPEFVRQAFSEGSIFASLNRAGYAIDATSILPTPWFEAWFWPSGSPVDVSGVRFPIRKPFVSRDDYREFSARQLLELSVSRHVPHLAKRALSENPAWFDRVFAFDSGQIEASQRRHEASNSAAFFEQFINAMSLGRDRPAYKLLHVGVPHRPVVLEADCGFIDVTRFSLESYLGQSRCAINLVAAFLDRLRDLGIYDNSLLVVSSDHGTHLRPLAFSGKSASLPEITGASTSSLPSIVGSARPLMMIKPIGQTGALEVSDAPTAHADLPATMLDLLGLPSDLGDQQMLERDPTLPRSRVYGMYDLRFRFPETHLNRLDLLTVEGRSTDATGWNLARSVMPPDQRLEPVEIDFGEGLDTAYLGPGWSRATQESTGDGKETSLVFGISEQAVIFVSLPPEPVELVARLSAPEHARLESIEVGVEGRTIAHWGSVDPDGYRDYAASIPADPDRPPISSITFHFDASTTDDILVKLNRVSFRVVHSY